MLKSMWAINWTLRRAERGRGWPLRRKICGLGMPGRAPGIKDGCSAERVMELWWPQSSNATWGQVITNPVHPSEKPGVPSASTYSHSSVLDLYTAPTKVDNRSTIESHREWLKDRRHVGYREKLYLQKWTEAMAGLQRVKDRCEPWQDAGEGDMGAGTQETPWGKGGFTKLFVFLFSF